MVYLWFKCSSRFLDVGMLGILWVLLIDFGYYTKFVLCFAVSFNVIALDFMGFFLDG